MSTNFHNLWQMYTTGNLQQDNISIIVSPQMVCVIALPCKNLDHDVIHIYPCLLLFIHSKCEKSLLRSDSL